MKPDYKRIYSDILYKNYPQKKEDCKTLLDKKNLSVLDIIELNKKIFNPINKETEVSNQQHRSYNKSDILKILDHQKKHKLNNSELANNLQISRNTVSKWRKIFIV